MTEAHVGVGIARDAYQAGVAAASGAKEQCSSSAPIQVAIVFASSDLEQHGVLRGVRSVVGESVPIVGASTAGEITSAGPAKADAVVVMLVASDAVNAAVHLLDDAAASDVVTKGSEAVTALTNQLAAQPSVLIMFADGLTVNPLTVMRALEAALPGVPIVGGSAGDNGKFKQTFQYVNDTVASSSVALLALSGPLTLGVGVRHGWMPISGVRTVTAADGVVVKTIDGKPAIELYKEFIGEEEAARLATVTLGEVALSYPLGVLDPESHELVLRAPFYAHPDGSITCGGEIPVGASVQLMIGSRDEAIAAAAESARRAFDQLGAAPDFALIFSCHVRNTLFASKEKAAKEIEAVRSVIGEHTPLAGFYTYAEQAPFLGQASNFSGCKPQTHNETLVTVLFKESHG